MGRYNFDTIVDRTNTQSLKYDFAVQRGKPADVKPFWVADMDFEIPQELKDRLIERINHGIFGYSESDESYFKSLYNWFQNRFNWSIKEEWLVKTPGIVFALAMAVRAFTEDGDSILINQPVYYPFSLVIDDNNRKLVNVPLIYREHRYTIDFEGIEKAIVENNVKLFLLCNPHNPVGRVWTKDELKRLGDICIRHNVLIVSDEIHADFVWEGHEHTVFATLGESYAQHSIICTAPSKTFNIAGLQVSNIFIPNATLRRRFIREINKAGFSQLNAMGLVACQGAYEVGAEWLDELKVYLQDNIQFTLDYFADHFPNITMLRPEGTYLMWFDCSQLPLMPEEREKWILEDGKLWLDSGSMFGNDGEQFERINIACPRSVLKDGLESLRRAYEVKGF